MLISIVECSDYRNAPTKSQSISVKKISEDVETVGPVSGPNVSAMRNAGAKKCSAEWIFFKDEDCSVDVFRIREIIKELEKEKNSARIVSGVYRTSRSTLWAKAYDRIQRKWVQMGLGDRMAKGFRSSSHLLGGALLVHRRTFQKFEGFNEAIGWGGEETEWVQRLRTNGIETGVCYRLRVIHQNDLGFLGFIKRAWFQNFHSSFHGFSSNKNYQKSLSYFLVPLHLVGPTLLFFSIAQSAKSVGLILRCLNRRGQTC